jgi:hypothetical protein
MKSFIQNLILFVCLFLGITSAKGGGVHRKLDEHGVQPSMQKSIAGMTKSGLSHDSIVKNIQRHFPSKSKSDINDIVIASNIAHKTSQARGAIKKTKKNGKR